MERFRFPFTDPFGRTVYRNVLMQYNDELLRQIASVTKGEIFPCCGHAH